MTDVILRPYMSQTDDPYIYSTWTKFTYYSDKKRKELDKYKYFKNKNLEIKQLLETGQVKVACLGDDPYFIVGYIVIKNGKREWICVKKDYWGQGIEDLLMRSMKGELNVEGIGTGSSTGPSATEESPGTGNPSLAR